MPSTRSISSRAWEPIVLERPAALADHDPLLRVPFDDQRGVHAGQLVAPLELLDHDRDRVRDLLPGDVERLLADDLGQPLVERLVRVVSVG